MQLHFCKHMAAQALCETEERTFMFIAHEWNEKIISGKWHIIRDKFYYYEF